MNNQCLKILLSLTFTFCSLVIFSQTSISRQNGFVPTDTVAIKIAEAVWLPIYGREIYTDTPFVAQLDTVTGIWSVFGTLPPRTHGGTANAKIQKSDGKIISVYHNK